MEKQGTGALGNVPVPTHKELMLDGNRGYKEIVRGERDAVEFSVSSS